MVKKGIIATLALVLIGAFSALAAAQTNVERSPPDETALLQSEAVTLPAVYVVNMRVLPAAQDQVIHEYIITGHKQGEALSGGLLFVDGQGGGGRPCPCTRPHVGIVRMVT